MVTFELTDVTTLTTLESARDPAAILRTDLQSVFAVDLLLVSEAVHHGGNELRACMPGEQGEQAASARVQAADWSR